MRSISSENNLCGLTLTHNRFCRTESVNTLCNFHNNNHSSPKQVFDKLPNYYTALSVPAHATAGCIAHSSSDLVMDFVDVNTHDDVALGRSDLRQLNKVPAYQSAFINSTRFDDTENHTAIFDNKLQRICNLQNNVETFSLDTEEQSTKHVSLSSF